MTSRLSKLMTDIIKILGEGNTFDSVLKMKLISVVPGDLKCEMTITEQHTNRYGNLHGGVTASLVDNVSTLSLMSAELPPGVSTDLNVTYLRPASIGDTVIIDAKCLKKGRTLAFLTVDITNKESGKLIAQGRHTKFIGQ
jgi:acyl-coenzyme A thioesterase 13